jgi:hypothetical protein
MYDRLVKLLIEGETQRTFPFHQEKEDNKKLIRSVRRSRAGLNVSINRRKGGPSRKNNPNQRPLFKLESSNRSPERVAKVNAKYRKLRQGSGQDEGKPNFITTKEGERARRAQKAKNDLPFQAGRN